MQGQQLTLQSGGDIDQFTATFNAFYDLPIGSWLTPYAGGGVGVNYINAQTAHFSGPAPSGLGASTVQFTSNGGTATNAMVFAEVGVAIALDERWSVVPAYRFQHVFVDNNGWHNEDNILTLGVRYAL